MDSLQPLLDQIRAASADRKPLRVTAGGTKDFYGHAVQGEVLDARPHAGIVSYEPSELYITAKAGTPLAELEAALAEKGQCLPFEPPHFSVESRLDLSSKPPHFSVGERLESLPQPPHFSTGSTVGGMVAAGLSGPARATAGSVRDYVLGVQIINGKAEHLTFGGQVMKNVAGYDVSRIMAGSWGTLGVITEVSLKVLPLAPAQATLRFVVDEAAMLHKLNTWGGQPLPLNASLWTIDNGQPTLYLRLRGAVAAVDAACKKLLAELPGERVDSLQTDADWNAARDLTLPWFTEGFKRGDDLWRLSVPQTAPALGVGDTMVDWLGAQRWVWAPSDDASAADRLRSHAQAVGGSATLFIAACAHPIRAAARFEPLKPPLDRIHQQLKAEFDPAGIFNPGRMPWFN